MNALEQLKRYTKVVADTGDFESMKQYQPQDATTNPSLLLKSAQDDRYKHVVVNALQYAKTKATSADKKLKLASLRLAVGFGLEILKIVPGRVSTEVDAHLSFNTEASVQYARQIIQLYQQLGADRSRVLIKLASTWEGIKAAEQLEKENIRCNLTLLFSMPQAVACGEAGVQLISPFVGRILDWHLRDRGVEQIPAHEDPGVVSVKNIYDYYKKFGYKTEVMGASFRNTGEVVELTGCDLLTISPALLGELEGMTGVIERKLDPERAATMNLEKVTLEEKKFRWLLNQDAMATEKLAEGIRKFAADQDLLEDYLQQLSGS